MSEEKKEHDKTKYIVYWMELANYSYNTQEYPRMRIFDKYDDALALFHQRKQGGNRGVEMYIAEPVQMNIHRKPSFTLRKR